MNLPSEYDLYLIILDWQEEIESRKNNTRRIYESDRYRLARRIFELMVEKND